MGFWKFLRQIYPGSQPDSAPEDMTDEDNDSSISLGNAARTKDPDRGPESNYRMVKTPSQDPIERVAELLDLGMAYASAGRYAEAIASYNQAIEYDEDNALAYYNRAWVHGKKEDYDNAITDYSAAIRLDASLAKAYMNPGWAYGQKGQHEQAIAT